MEHDDQMTDNQPCLELQTLDIFKPDIIEGVKELYLPVFEKIRLFGTVDEPVFVAKDVQEALGLKDMNYSRDGLWEWGLEKVKIKIKTTGGVQSVIALTEQGLYKSIWHSKTEMAKKFQTFMTCVMKRLRMNGSVTMTEAIEDYREKLAWMEQKDKALNMQMDIEHKDLVRLKARDEKREVTLHEQSTALYKATKRLENQRDPNVSELNERLTRLLKRTGRPIYIMLSEAPKEHRETHLYDLTNYSEFDEDFIDPSEVMIFSIGLSPLKSKVATKKVYVHKTVKLDDVHAALLRYRLERGTGGHYQNNYEISLDRFDIVIDDINRADEDAQPAE